MKVEAWFRTSLPLEDVFAYLAEWENAAHWNSWTRWVRKLSDAPTVKGTVFRASFKTLGEMDEVVTDFEPPSRLAIGTDTPQATGSLTFDLAAEGSGTKGHMQMEMQPKGSMRVIAPLMMPLIMRRHIRDMAAAIERELHSPTRTS